jgi:hypothetical protein
VPITAGCTAQTDIPVFQSPGSMSQTVTIGNQYIAPGQHAFLAAKQMPNGQILLAIGTVSQTIPIPSCFPATTG